MKFGTQIVAVVAVLGALICTIWLARTPDVATAKPEYTATPFTDAPKPSETGPHPKAVIDQTTYDFGTMMVGSKGEHTFEIHNEGEADLELVANKGDTTCQCTFGELKDGKLEPGQSTPVTVSWQIKSAASMFRHSATVRTNDPENQSIVLTVQGFVGQLLTADPSLTWTFETIPEDRPAELAGVIYSEILDDFNIVGVESPNPLLTAEATKFDEEKLEALKQEKIYSDPAAALREEENKPPEMPLPKSAYQVKVTLAKGVPVGKFREQLLVKTDLKDMPEMTVYIEGHRTGPLEFFRSPGTNWIPKLMRAGLGRFAAQEGTKGMVTMYITRPETPLKIEDVESELDYLKVTVERDEAYAGKSRERFKIHFEVPPGSPPAAKNGDNAVNVRIKTNHPDADVIPLSVDFLSY